MTADREDLTRVDRTYEYRGDPMADKTPPPPPKPDPRDVYQDVADVRKDMDQRK